jgi:transmembrane sensor
MSQREHHDAVVAEQARDWVVRLLAEGVGSDERLECAQWRAADTRHEAAYRRAEGLWNHLGQWKELAELEPLHRRTDRTYWLAAAATVAAVAIFAVWYLRPGSPPYSPQISTQTAEIRDVTLADGSVVTLGARSRLKLAFSKSERRVQLTGGDAFFSVVKDPLRPFVVEVGDTLVRVMGTKFDVHRGPEQVRISVLEGAVQVMDKYTLTMARPLTAGQEIVAFRGQLEAVRTVDPAKPGAWRKGRLIYVDASLAEVVADANRYFDKRIEFGAPQLAELRLTAAFRANQIDEMIHTLERTLPVDADRSAPDKIVLRAIAHR